MPADDVQIKRIPAVRVAELTATAAGYRPEHISPVIQPLYHDLHERVARAGLSPAGPAIAYYEDSPAGDGTVIVHAAFPIDAAPGDEHDFAIVDLPEIEQAATILHRGSMDDVMRTVRILARWIDGNGYRGTGHAREHYIEFTPSDPESLVTELQEPIAKV
jgi:effector-binding domain-containing protein